MTISEINFYNSLKEFVEENGYVPTIRELGDYVGFSSPATTHFYLSQLEKKGCIKRINNRKIEFKGVEEWNN